MRKPKRPHRLPSLAVAGAVAGLALIGSQTVGQGVPHQEALAPPAVEILGEQGVIGAKTGSYVSKNIYNLVTAWRAPNGETIVGVVLGSAGHPARYDDMHAIMAALLHDFPILAEPTAGATYRTSEAAGSCQ